jgi:hypothetical protein
MKSMDVWTARTSKAPPFPTTEGWGTLKFNYKTWATRPTVHLDPGEIAIPENRSSAEENVV